MTGTSVRYVIVNADDFGSSEGINRGIIEAHETGIVTSASLMVNAPATEAAVELARDHQALSLGLHVNFTGEGEEIVDLRDLQAVNVCRGHVVFFQWLVRVQLPCRCLG